MPSTGTNSATTSSSLVQIGQQAHRLAVAAAARQVAGFQRVGDGRWWRTASAGRWCEQGSSSLQLVAFLEFQFGRIGDRALHRADPALVGQDDGDRLALDQRLAGDIHRRPARRPVRCGDRPAGPEPNFLRDVFQFDRDAVPAQRLVTVQQRARSPCAPWSGCRCSRADFHLLQPAQAAQPHVEDRVGLRVGQRRSAPSARGFGSSSSRMMRITSSRLR